MNALVVDDDSTNREHVRQILEGMGFTSQGFETADQAAAALSELHWPVGLVVTDVQMPGSLDGIDLASRLAKTRPELPVVVMSSSGGELRRAITRGLAVPTLQKPIVSRDLESAVFQAQFAAWRRRGTPGRFRRPLPQNDKTSRPC